MKAAVIPIVTACATWALSMPVPAVPIVQFEDGQVVADQDFTRTFQTATGDYDTNGILDQMATIVYSAAQPLCVPSASYLGQPFYGGYIRYYWNQTNVAQGFISKVNNSNQFLDADFINLRTMQASQGETEKFGCYIWKKADFINNGNLVRVDLDPTNSFRFAFQTVNFGGINIRYIVQLGTNMYISEEQDTTGSSTSWLEFKLDNETLSLYWAPYNPSASLYFDSASASYDYYPLEDVQAVGVYFHRPRTGTNYTPNLQWRITNFVVEATIVTGGGPQIAVAPSTLNFGAAAPGQTNAAALNVYNVGGGLLEGVVSNVAPPFFVLSNGAYSIAASGSNVVLLGFAPPDSGAYTNEIVCTGGGDATVTLLGNIPPGVPYIVEFDGATMISQDMDFARMWLTLTGEFGMAAGPDEKALVPFSDAQPLAAGGGAAYSGQSLYGGIERIYFDATGVASNLLARMSSSSKAAIARMYADQATPTRAVQFLYFDKSDFYHGGDAMPVALTSDSELYAKIKNELFAGGEVRFAVRTAGQFYLSSAAFTFGFDVQEYRLTDPTLVFWAPYDPAADLYFNAGGASFGPLVLDDVTAIGVYCMREEASSTQHQMMWKTMSVTATGALIPEPAGVMAGVLGVGVWLWKRAKTAGT